VHGLAGHVADQLVAPRHAQHRVPAIDSLDDEPEHPIERDAALEPLAQELAARVAEEGGLAGHALTWPRACPVRRR